MPHRPLRVNAAANQNNTINQKNTVKTARKLPVQRFSYRGLVAAFAGRGERIEDIACQRVMIECPNQALIGAKSMFMCRAAHRTWAMRDIARIAIFSMASKMIRVRVSPRLQYACFQSSSKTS
jgi:hypothetical protein